MAEDLLTLGRGWGAAEASHVSPGDTGKESSDGWEGAEAVPTQCAWWVRPCPLSRVLALVPPLSPGYSSRPDSGHCLWQLP